MNETWYLSDISSSRTINIVALLCKAKNNKHFLSTEVAESPLEKIHLTNNRDYASFSSAAKERRLKGLATMDTHRSPLWFDMRLMDVKMARAFFNLSPSHREREPLFCRLSMRYHLLFGKPTSKYILRHTVRSWCGTRVTSRVESSGRWNRGST